MTSQVLPAILKRDAFGQIVRMANARTQWIRRDLADVHPWVLPLAQHLLRREARALSRLRDVVSIPRCLDVQATWLDRSYLSGEVLYHYQPYGHRQYFSAARRLLQQLHRRGVTHNDLAKEANWLVMDGVQPGLVDFQLASCGPARSAWIRLLAWEDLRHLLKHKRTYCPLDLTPIERRVLARPSWVRRMWFLLGKPPYRFVTRRLLHWRDGEGRGTI